MDTENSLIEDVLQWAKHPFNAEGSAFNWVLFVGLLIVASFLWRLVLLMIARETE